MKYIKTFEELNNRDIMGMIKKYGSIKLKEILEYDKDINKRYEIGNTLLILACICRNYYLAKDLIDNYNADVNIQNNHGETALIGAVKLSKSSGDIGYKQKIVKLLIDSGAKLNIRNKIGETALMNVFFDDYETVKILLEAGADLNIKDNNNKDFFANFAYFGTYDNDNLLDKIEKDFPKIYKEYLEKKLIEIDTDKYNL